MTAKGFPGKTLSGGGAFLVRDADVDEIFTPEDFTPEHRQIADTTEEFVSKEVLPVANRIEQKDWQLTRELIRKAADLGLTLTDIPEAYGGMQLDKVSSAIIAEKMSRYAGFAVTFSGQTGIGLLPIVYFGTEQQKQRYLPKLASGEWIGSYALTESSAGSDPLNCRTRATLSPDGKHYLLNGEKMWITNSSFADLFIVFAKIDGDKFTAFIVERTAQGFTIGPEEHKMGLRGSSTCSLIFEDCPVPVDNLLGGIGKGHEVAFNILNIGRFKLGAMALGAARASLADGIEYAKQRTAFGKPIAEFGLIREKLARMAATIYVLESILYRTVGMIDTALGGIETNPVHTSAEIRDAIAEYAIECSIIKVMGSEMLDYVVDEVLQIHGGYGFSEEYSIERAYRDARVSRIFEGTNEINRLIISGFLLKRAAAGKLELAPERPGEERFVNSARPEAVLIRELEQVWRAKQALLFSASAAVEKYGKAVNDQQEILGALADMIMGVYAMESSILRAQKIAARRGRLMATAVAMTQLYVTGALTQVSANAAKIMAAVTDDRRTSGDIQMLQDCFPRPDAFFDSIQLQRQIAATLVE